MRKARIVINYKQVKQSFDGFFIPIKDVLIN